TMASGVVQLFRSLDDRSWEKMAAGVVTLIRDNEKRSFFIRVFSIVREMQLFEQELYLQFELKQMSPFFYAFEGDDCMYGVNFANEQEARFFYDAVTAKVRDRRTKKSRRRQSAADGYVTSGLPPSSQPVTLNGDVNANVMPGSSSRFLGPSRSPAASSAASRSYSPSSSGFRLKKNRGKKEAKGKLSKGDIGAPTG
ncbi:unnamed protein product, partial [Cyprideis torosa]